MSVLIRGNSSSSGRISINTYNKIGKSKYHLGKGVTLLCDQSNLIVHSGVIDSDGNITEEGDFEIGLSNSPYTIIYRNEILYTNVDESFSYYNNYSIGSGGFYEYTKVININNDVYMIIYSSGGSSSYSARVFKYNVSDNTRTHIVDITVSGARYTVYNFYLNDVYYILFNDDKLYIFDGSTFTQASGFWIYDIISEPILIDNKIYAIYSDSNKQYLNIFDGTTTTSNQISLNDSGIADISPAGYNIFKHENEIYLTLEIENRYRYYQSSDIYYFLQNNLIYKYDIINNKSTKVDNPISVFRKGYALLNSFMYYDIFRKNITLNNKAYAIQGEFDQHNSSTSSDSILNAMSFENIIKFLSDDNSIIRSVNKGFGYVCSCNNKLFIIGSSASSFYRMGVYDWYTNIYAKKGWKVNGIEITEDGLNSLSTSLPLNIEMN